MNGQQVTLHLLVPNTEECPCQPVTEVSPGVKQTLSWTGSQGCHPIAESQDLWTMARLCQDLCKVMLIPANKTVQIMRKIVNYLIQPPGYLRPLIFALIFLY